MKHEFCRHYNFGRVDYVIGYNGEAKSETEKAIDREYLRQIENFKFSRKCNLAFSIIGFIICLGLCIANGIALDKGLHQTIFTLTLGILFEIFIVILGLGLLIWIGAGDDISDDFYHKLEDLYILSEAGKIQYNKQKQQYEEEEKNKNDRKADQLITTYDTLDSNMEREKKIEIISNIIKNMEE